MWEFSDVTSAYPVTVKFNRELLRVEEIAGMPPPPMELQRANLQIELKEAMWDVNRTMLKMECANFRIGSGLAEREETVSPSVCPLYFGRSEPRGLFTLSNSRWTCNSSPSFPNEFQAWTRLRDNNLACICPALTQTFSTFGRIVDGRLNRMRQGVHDAELRALGFGLLHDLVDAGMLLVSGARRCWSV